MAWKSSPEGLDCQHETDTNVLELLTVLLVLCTDAVFSTGRDLRVSGRLEGILY